MLSDEALNNQLDYIVQAIVQVYKTIHDYKLGLYPNLEFNSKKIIHPVIVTLENWYIFGPQLISYIEAQTIIKMVEVGLPENYIIEMPWSIMSASEFENAVQILQRTETNPFFIQKNDGEKKEWAFGNYMHTEYQELYSNCKSLFEEELEEFFSSAAEY